MPRSYYYLIASLPTLSLGGTAPFTVREMRGLLERQLEGGDYAIMASLALSRGDDAGEIPSSLPDLLSYYSWEAWARYELAKARSARRGVAFAARRPAMTLCADFSREAEALSAAVMQAPNPLEGEMLVEYARWAFLDRIKARHFFDLEWLAAYLLQLLTLTRVSHFDPAAGRARFDATYEAVLASVNVGSESGVNE